MSHHYRRLDGREAGMRLSLTGITWLSSHWLLWELYLGPSGAGPVYIRDLKLPITVPEDDFAPDGIRPSADTVLIEKFDIQPSEFIPQLIISYMPSLSIHQNTQWPTKSRGTWSVSNCTACCALHYSRFSIRMFSIPWDIVMHMQGACWG